MGKTKRYTIWGNTVYVLSNIIKWDRPLLWFMLIQAASGALIPLLGIYIPKAVIDEVTHFDGLPRLIGIIVGLTAATALLSVADRYSTGRVNASSMANRTRYLLLSNAKTLTCDYDAIENAQGQQMRGKLNAAVNQERGGPQAILRALPLLLSSVAGLFLYSAVLASLHSIILISLLATSFVNYFVLRYITRAMEKHRDEYSIMINQFWYIFRNMRDFRVGKDFRLYRMKPWFLALYESWLVKDYARNARSAKCEYLSDITDAAVILLRDGVAYAFLIYYTLNGSIGISDFVLYFGAITGFSVFINGAAEQINEVARSSLDVTAIRTFLDMPDRPRGTTPPPSVRPLSIVFDDVSFRYDDGAYILKNLTLRIDAGEKLAVIGANGAGKTTLIKLLCGFYKPESGRILIDGVPLDDIPRDDAYALFTAVFQDILILPFSVAQNVALSPAYDADRVRDCLCRAGLGDRLPDIDAPLTKVSHADGIELSGGEQQKLLLARALYKDAPVMLLDEPTAALDPIAESKLYQSYYELSKDKTSIYISHRLASASFCDRIAYIADGRVAELGTHDELMRQGGGYAHMFNVQSHYYREGVEAEEVCV